MKVFKNGLYLLSVIIAMVLLVFGGTIVAQIIMNVFSACTGIMIPVEVECHVSGNAGIALTAIFVTVYANRNKKNTQVSERFQFTRALVYMVLAVCVCQILTNVTTTALFSNVFPVEAVQSQGKNTLVDLLFAIVVAPVVEELLFRKGFYVLLQSRYTKKVSVLITTLFFTLFHGYQLQGFLSCMVAGLVFLLLYEKTGNIAYSIGAHMLCNLFATIMNSLEAARVTWMGMAIQYEVQGYVMFHPLIIISAIIFCGAVFATAYRKRTVKILSV